jgi:homoserine dehydrogenase
MALRSIKSFETRWAKLRQLAAAQLKDFQRDRKEVAKAIKKHKVKNDVIAVRDAVAHSKQVERAIKTTRDFVAKNQKKVAVRRAKVVREAKRRGSLLKRALT